MVMAATISGHMMVNDKLTGRVSSSSAGVQSSRISSFKGSALRILSPAMQNYKYDVTLTDNAVYSESRIQNPQSMHHWLIEVPTCNIFLGLPIKILQSDV